MSVGVVRAYDVVRGHLGQGFRLASLFALVPVRTEQGRAFGPTIGLCGPGFLHFGLVLVAGLMGTPDQHFLQHSVVHRGERG